MVTSRKSCTLVRQVYVAVDFLDLHSKPRQAAILGESEHLSEMAALAYLHARNTGQGALVQRELRLFGRIFLHRDEQGCPGFVRWADGSIKVVRVDYPQPQQCREKRALPQTLKDGEAPCCPSERED